MKNVVFTICILLMLILNTGCATIIHGKYQTVPVSSMPPGANVRSSSGDICVTPCQLNLLRDNEYVLVASLDGYDPQQQSVGKDTSGWFWANIILGGIVGGVIDKASGSGEKLVPGKIHFDFEAGKIYGAKDTKSELVEIPKTPIDPNEIPKETLTAKNKLIKKCENCGSVIGKLEKSYTFEKHLVCAECYKKLKNQD